MICIIGTLLSKDRKIVTFIKAFIMVKYCFLLSILSSLQILSSWIKMLDSKPIQKFVWQLRNTILKSGTQLGQYVQCSKQSSVFLMKIFKESGMNKVLLNKENCWLKRATISNATNVGSSKKSFNLDNLKSNKRKSSNKRMNKI